MEAMRYFCHTFDVGKRKVYYNRNTGDTSIICPVCGKKIFLHVVGVTQTPQGKVAVFDGVVTPKIDVTRLNLGTGPLKAKKFIPSHTALRYGMN